MSILAHVPNFSLENAIQIAERLYSLHVTAISLPSERDQNFLLQADNQEHFVLKISNAMEEPALLNAQNQTMLQLAKHVDFCPNVVPAKNGEDITTVKALNGEEYFVRLVTYLPGIPLADVKHHSNELLHDIGFKIGQLTNALQGFDHPALHRDLYWDLANGPDIVRKYGELIHDETLRETILKLASDFEDHTAPLLPSLQKSVIYNDANDYNLLAGGGDDPYSHNQSIVGIIDFGDMVHSYTIGDLAVAIAYAILDKPDPLAAAEHIIMGYQAASSLQKNELAVLFSLVTMRLCMSACIAAEQQALQPENEYLGISQKPIRATLPKLAAIHPRFAEAVFRDACGLDSLPYP